MLLFSLCVIPLFTAVLINLVNFKTNLLKMISFFSSYLNFLISLNLWFFYDNTTHNYQFLSDVFWSRYWDIHVHFGVDGLSIFFILLTTFLTPICLLSGFFFIKKDLKLFISFFLLLESLILFVSSLFTNVSVFTYVYILVCLYWYYFVYFRKVTPH
jgi:NADH:ubiquinone oxidoreductase subunit 4 (subunit M)